MYFEEVFKNLNNEKIRYVVVGGVALVLHGVVRFTADLDLMLEMSHENLDKFVFVMNKLGYKPKAPVKPEEFIDPDKRKTWKDEKGMQVFTFFHPHHPISLIDVFIDHPIDFSKVEQNEVSVTAKGISIPVASVEDLKYLKKISGRPQDLADIEALENIERMKNNNKQ